MKKIVSLFKRNYKTDFLVRDEVVEGAEWVLAGEGIATRKFDGTCCMIENGRLYKRREVRQGKKPPEGFIPETDVDPNTGKRQGWLRVGDGNEDVYYREALFYLLLREQGRCQNGTYELCGPKVQGNPESFDRHVLVFHGNSVVFPDPPRTFSGLKAWFVGIDLEGIVWHHLDGRMVKIKKKDFGLCRDE